MSFTVPAYAIVAPFFFSLLFVLIGFWMGVKYIEKRAAAVERAEDVPEHPFGVDEAIKAEHRRNMALGPDDIDAIYGQDSEEESDASADEHHGDDDESTDRR